MKKFNLILTYMLLTFIFSSTFFAQDKSEQKTFQTEVDGIGTNALTFLEIGVGARAMGMGGAYAAVSNDASSIYWNPAGIVWIENMEFEVMHNSWFLDANNEFFGAVFPIAELNSSLGISFTTLGFGDQPVRTVNRPEGTGESYSARDYSAGITWATALTDRFSFGISFKYISSQIWHETGTAFATDFGIFYNTELEGLRLGFSMNNFGTDIKYEGQDIHTTVDPDIEVENFDRVPSEYQTDSYPIPLLFRAGISYEANLGGFGSAIAAIDLLHPSNSPEAINAGIEYSFAKMFFLRGGYEGLFDSEAFSGLTLGAGIDYYNNSANFGVRFDYSWADWGILENSQRFSVGLVF
ncbi:MAG: PorV/PorQ family protein [Ignavibacteriae bacterium]|nr:PorV/PorQ family protein [Ignavibacteriota bacterium]